MDNLRDRITQKLSTFFEPTTDVRIRDVARDVPGVIKNFIQNLSPKKEDLVKEAQEKARQTFLPEVAEKKALELAKEHDPFVLGFGGKDERALSVDPFGAVGSIRRSVVLSAKTLKNLAAEKSKSVISSILKKEAPELSEQLIKKVTPRIAKSNTPAQILKEVAKVSQQNIGIGKGTTISERLKGLLTKKVESIPVENATPKRQLSADLLRRAAPEASDDIVTKFAKQIDEVNGQGEINALVRQFKNEADTIVTKADTLVDNFESTSQNLIRHIKENSGITADFKGNIIDKGYAVSILNKADETRLPINNDFDKAFIETFNKMKAQYGSSAGAHFGGWVDETGDLVVDISKLTDNIKESIYDGIIRKQDAIGDLGRYSKGEDGTIYISKEIIDSIEPLSSRSLADSKSPFKSWDEVVSYYKSKDFKNSNGVSEFVNQNIPKTQTTPPQPQGKILQKTAQETPPPSSRPSASASAAQKVSSDTRPLPKVNNENGVKSIEGTPAQKVNANPEDIKSINDLIDRTQINLRASTATGDLTKRDLKKEVAELIKRQGKTIGDEEIRKLREENLLGAETIDEIILRKRGIITDEEAIERAKRMQGTLEDVLNIPKGTALNKEQLKQVSQIVQEEREINKKLIQLADGKGIPSTQEERDLLKRLGEGISQLTDHQIINRALEESTLKLRKAEIVLLASKSEAGRALQGAKGIVDAVDSRMRIMFGKMRKLNDLEHQAMIEQLGKMHLDDNKEFLKFLDEYSTADLFDKFAEWATAAKLWNPTTHAVNFGGNTLRALTDMVITGITSPGQLKADLTGARVGLGHGLKNALKAMTDEGYAATLSKYIEEGGTAPAIGSTLGKYVRTPFRLLGASDEIFRTMAYQRSLYRQAHRKARGSVSKMKELLEKPTITMMEEATEQSKRLTFQEDMGEITMAINRMRTPAHFKSKTAKAGSTILRLFVPFLKTPTNLFKQAVDFSPVGLIKNAHELKKLLNAGENEHAKRLLGEAIFGTLLSAYVVSETLDGRITGGAPRDPSERDRFYRENKLPYAIKIGDNWYQYKRVDPFSTVIASVADMISLAKTDGVSIGGLFGSVADQLQDKTYIQGLSDLITIFTGEDYERDYAVKNMILGAALPSFVGHIARTVDPKVRSAKTIVDRIKSQIPFVSTSLPVKVNVLGADIERANKGLNFFFNPIQSEIAEIDPITKHLMDIDYTIPVPDASFKRDKVDYKLTEEQYAIYAKSIGTDIAKAIEAEMRKTSYQRLSNEKKIDKIQKIRRDIMDEWKDDFVKKNKPTGGSYESYRQRVINGIAAGKITKEQGIELLKKAKAATQ